MRVTEVGRMTLQDQKERIQRKQRLPEKIY